VQQKEEAESNAFDREMVNVDALDRDRKERIQREENRRREEQAAEASYVPGADLMPVAV
jgi:hypothetical protein